MYAVVQHRAATKAGIARWAPWNAPHINGSASNPPKIPKKIKGKVKVTI